MIWCKMMMTKFYWPKGQTASYMDLLYLHPDSFWQYLSSVYLHVYGDLFYYLISTITIYHAGSHNIDSDFIFSEQQMLFTYEMTSNENENWFFSSVYDLNKNHSMWLSKVLLVQTTCSGISTYEFSKLCQCQYLLSINI